MAFKHKVHHWFTVIRRLKTWQLLVILAVLVVVSAFLLRQNNLEMVRLRAAVDKADQENGDVKGAVLSLQRYVTSHMNTDLGTGIALQYTYQRDYEAAVQAAASSTNPQAALYTQVEAECQPVFRRTHSFPAYTQCAHDKLSQLAPGQDALGNMHTPSADLYKISFASPIWSFDIAGIFVLLTALILLILILRSITYLALRALLRAHR